MTTTSPEILEMIREAKEKGLTELRLAVDPTIPEEIRELKQLTLLFITGKYSEISEWIGELKQLTELFLAGNYSEIPNGIRELKHMTNLYLSGSYSEIPEGIGELKQLTELYFSGSYSEIPEWIGELKQLTKLYLSGSYREIPEWIGELKQLTGLSLSGSYREIPEWIGELKQLTELSLYGSYSEIPEGIGELKQLTELSLYGTYREIPEGIGKLKQLTELSLSGTYREIPEDIGELKQLTRLSLRGVYREIPEWIGELKQLPELSLYGSYSEIPEWIGELKQLKELILFGQYKYLPDAIWSLSKLEKMHLVSEQLSAIPSLILHLTSLTQLIIRTPNIQSPPPEIVDRGLQAVREYFIALQEGEKDYLYEAKLLIIGEGEAGKTSLARKLDDPHAPMPIVDDTTRGIEVAQWRFPFKENKEFRVNVWDFGGQEIYHATHQFFLTKRSLYALIVDTRKEDINFGYWLNIVELLSNNSPVLIVKNEKQDRLKEINEPQLRERFSNLKEVIGTNLQTGRNLESVRAEISHQITKLEHIGIPLSKKWVDVRRELEGDSRDFIRYSEFNEICYRFGIEEDEQVETLIDYLHDLGVCLHFKEDMLLKQYVILKPNWSTRAVYTLLDNPDVHEKSGRFSRKELKNIWDAHDYKGAHDILLSLMLRFGLCYQIEGTEFYIAPQLLDVKKASYSWDSDNNIVLLYKYAFMPKGIISRFIVEMHSDIMDKLVWRTGVVIKGGDAIAEVMENYDRSEISIRIRGEGKKSLMAVILRKFQEIHRKFQKLKYDLYVPCTCSVCSDSQDVHFFSFDYLERAEKASSPVQCQKSFQMIEARALINDIQDAMYSTARRWGNAARMSEKTFKEFLINTDLVTQHSVMERELQGDIHFHFEEKGTTYGSVGKQQIGEEIMNVEAPEAKSEKKDAVPPLPSAWRNGSFYVVVALAIGGLLLVFNQQMSPLNFALSLIAMAVLITIIGAFQLRQDDKLKDKAFLDLMGMAFAQIPLLGQVFLAIQKKWANDKK